MLNGNGLVALANRRGHHTECQPDCHDTHVLADLANTDPRWATASCGTCKADLADPPASNPVAVEYGREWLDRGMSLEHAGDMAYFMGKELS